jgi:hypothetical protein
MWATIGAALILFWLVGFFAVHVSTGLIHIALVGGLITLLVHLREMSRRSIVKLLAERSPQI